MYIEEGRYTLRHISAQWILAKYFKTILESSLYADLSSFLSPSIIMGDTFRPDLLLLTTNNRMFILELTAGFETNLDINSKRKREKYLPLTRHL